MMENTITINEFGFRHISDWTIFPWIETGDKGWQFTWVFFQFTRYTCDESELDDDGDFPDDGAW
jgi:hypothetical protein